MRVAERFEAWVEQRKRRHVRNVLRRFGAPTDARLADAANEASKTGAQSYRVLLESIGWAGKGASVHIGDVNIGQVTISDERRQVILSESPAERDARMRTLAEQLGLE
jgi:hypothetical protein